MEAEKNLNEAEETVNLSTEEIEVIAAKTGYSTSTVSGVLRGYIPRIQRHQPIFEFYSKVKHLRELHRENYLKDIADL